MIPMNEPRADFFTADLDPIYPDTNDTNGYKGQLQCGVYKVCDLEASPALLIQK